MVGPVRERQFGGIILSVLLIGGASGAIFLDLPFEPSRPRGTDIEFFHRVGLAPARQWQDPFTAVADKIENHRDHEKQTHPEQRFEDQWQQVRNRESPIMPIIMPVMVFGGSYAEQIESRRRSRYAVLSALYVNGYRPLDSEHIGFVVMDVSGHHPPSSKDDTARANPQKYMPNKDRDPLQMTVPYEWFVANTASFGEEERPPPILLGEEERPPPILLLWLDDFKFERDSSEPLKSLADVVNSFGRLVEPTEEQRAKIKVKIIGPAGSTMLHAMVNNAWEIIKPGGRPHADTPMPADSGTMSRDVLSHPLFDSDYVEIYSPTSTASAKLIIQDIKPGLRQLLHWLPDEKCSNKVDCYTIYPVVKNDEESSNKFTSLHMIDSLFHRVGISFFRTILSDRGLLNEFVQNELPKWRVNVCDPGHRIAVISEWDTFYGRALPEAFGSAIKQGRKEKLKMEDVCENLPILKSPASLPDPLASANGKLLRFVYMRGLDGETLTKDEKSVGRDKSERDKDGDKNKKPLERAAGDSQFDYLRRLADSIEKSSQQKGGNPAIFGVLGSDVYDKLLVLQALRKRFPQALFFTTDLDARFQHPSERAWARNILVGTTYGLVPKLYRRWPASASTEIEPPAFRDSYQTSVFTAVHLAFNGLRRASDDSASPECRDIASAEDPDIFFRCELATQLKPRIFEIGKDRAHDLNEPPPVVDSIFLKVWALVLFLSFSLFMSWTFRNWIYFVIPLAAVISAGSIFVIARSQLPGGEPLGLANGISIWPSEAIRLFALILAAGLLWRGSRELLKNRRTLSAKYMLGESDFELHSATGLASIFEQIRLSGDGTNNTVRTLWSRYLDIGGAGKTRIGRLTFVLWRNHRFHRVLLLAALFLSFGFTVLTLDYPYPPARGSVAFWADQVVLYSAVFALLVLLFYVVDVTFSCRRFVDLIGGAPRRSGSTGQAYLWPVELLRNTVKDLLPLRPFLVQASAFAIAPDEKRHAEWRVELARNWLNIKFIGDRTEAVTPLIYYPAIIMPLMIISRSKMFDNWHFPPGLAVIIAISVSLLLAAIVLLNIAAREARKKALDNMRAVLPRANASKDDSVSKNARLLIEDVETINLGAFQPLFEQPLFRALLLPSGGVGGLVLIERFLQ